MPQLQTPFNAANYDPTQGSGNLPLGRHPFRITDSAIKANKDGNGGHLDLTVQIIEGPNAGISGAYRLNLYHPDQKTAEIAHRQLSALCYITGRMSIVQTEDLHNGVFLGEVTNQKLTPKQLEAQQAGQEVTPYTQLSKVFYMDGREPGKENQAPTAAAPMPPQAAATAYQQQAPQQAPVQQQAPAAGWNQQQAPTTQQQAPAFQPPQQQAAPQNAWSQQGTAGAAKPSWNTK